MEKLQKYKRAVVFSGGGSRFAVYGGIFSAMKDMGYEPDLIIGSCGGAMAASIINSFETTNEIKEYMKSLELYNFINSLKLTKEKMLYRIGIDCKLRELRKKLYIENIFDKYLVDIPENLENYLPTLNKEKNSSVKVVIIGSKILFNKSEIGKVCKNRKLYKEIIFTDKKTEKLLKEDELKIKSNVLLKSAIMKKAEIVTDIPLLKAARISISDMFYTKPVSHNEEYFAGGAVNLVPIELAKTLADEVALELKQEYDRIEDSSVKSVLGYSGNERLREVNDSYGDYWIDTSDIPSKLKGHYVTAKVNLFKLQVELSVPHEYEKFKNDIEIQWNYGYERGKEALINGKNNKKNTRNKNIYNTSEIFRKINNGGM
ncbi:patatin-like phospholipase family protein [Fusobacterium varium]|uniref:patatin-like phospholipase family protein n=1 Tax=Fusobacterium varium TaxID=856 RepID=UPI00242BC807|nr:patatin-like phospholipase family protein [Fusobacterium varium]